MLLQPYNLGCLTPASYSIADKATRPAVMVDLPSDIDAYLHAVFEQDFHMGDVSLLHGHK